MKKLIDRLVERAYYKRFPVVPFVPVVKEDRGDIVKLKAEIVISQEEFDKVPRDLIRKELLYKLSRMIEPAVEIKEERDRYIGSPIYITGLISVVRRRDYGS